jgi:TonB family protein
VGALCGTAAVALLVAKKAAAHTWALVTLIASVASAGTGFVARQRELQRADALFATATPVHQARVHRLAFEEARRGPQFGFAGSLLPLMLGAVAALLAARGRPRALGTAAALSLAAAGGCALSLWLARAPTPKDAFDFGDHDEPAWDLAFAIETVGTDPAAGCNMLEVALEPYWQPADRLQWPRQLTREPPRSLASWRAAADTCVRAALSHSSGVQWNPRLLLASPQLQAEDLRANVEALLMPAAPTPTHLDKDAIASVVMSRRPEFRLCYELELQRQPSLAGRVAVHFTIGADGTVLEANTDGSFPAPAVSQCLLARFRALRFPPPDDGEPVEVNYPFVFTAAAPAR